MNIILFGPPGIGKSTLIGHLKTLGQRAIDLEDLYPNRMRFQVPNLVDDTYLGAADLAPQRKYGNAIKVLLYADQAKYEQRRSARDAKQPGKANQTAHLIENWMTAPYDILLPTDDQTPDQVARTLISLVERRKQK